MQKERKAFEKREKDRKRNLLVLIQKYLLDNGWIDSLMKLEQESTISLDHWAVADNVDLSVVYADFEQYYDVRFGNFPLVVKKREADEDKKPTRKLPLVKKPEQRPADPKDQQAKPTDTAKTPTTQASQKDARPKQDRKPEGQPGAPKGLEIEGETIDVHRLKPKKRPEEEPGSSEEYFQSRVLKGIPDFYANNGELRELALSLQRDIIVQSPNVSFRDIVGLEDAKRMLREAVRLPLLFPQLFTGLVEPWKGALLFGPPGTGKVPAAQQTLLAKAVASECRTIFFNISASSVVSKWQGESEKLIRVLFELARHHQPSTIFLDEIDSIMSQRSGSSRPAD